MPLIFDADISGTNEASFDATVIRYWLFYATSTGGSVRSLEAAAPDHILRFGWVALGASAVGPDTVTRHFWQRPVHIDFLTFEWMPEATSTATPPDRGVWSDRVRWSFALGCAGRLQLWN